MDAIKNAYTVLSRKYRPCRLDDIIGQDMLVTSLKNSIDNNRVPHAFLFYGIRGIGKTTTARILARCLNCLGPDGNRQMTSNPCGVCKSCRAMDTDSHLDVLEMDAASRTGVDDIREIIDASQYMPVLGRYKIFIIDEVHMLSKSAFNALLKTLEEPPSHVKFIFATTEIQKVPETILSRCMTFNLKSVPLETISEHIVNIASKENFNIEKDAADLIASEADGSVRDALSLLDQAIMLSLKEHIIKKETIVAMVGGVKYSDIDELINMILAAKTREVLLKIETLLTNGAETFTLCKSIQTILYKKITEAVSAAVNSQYSLSNLLYIWQIFIKQIQNIKTAPYPEQVLKAAVVIMSHTASFPDIDKLVLHEHSSAVKPQENIKQQVSDLIKATENSSTKDEKQLINNILKYFPDSSVKNLF